MAQMHGFQNEAFPIELGCQTDVLDSGRLGIVLNDALFMRVSKFSDKTPLQSGLGSFMKAYLTEISNIADRMCLKQHTPVCRL